MSLHHAPSEFGESTRESGARRIPGKLGKRASGGRLKPSARRSIGARARAEATFPPSAAFNISLPARKAEFPLTYGLSTCIGPNSADQIVLKFTADRPAHYQLRIVAKATDGRSISRTANVDVLVPRFDYFHKGKEGQFFTAKDSRGCS